MHKTFRFLKSAPNIYRVDFPYRLYLHEADPLSDPTHFTPFRSNGKHRNPGTTIEIFNERHDCIAALLINNMIPVPPIFFMKNILLQIKKASLFLKMS